MLITALCVTFVKYTWRITLGCHVYNHKTVVLQWRKCTVTMTLLKRYNHTMTPVKLQYLGFNATQIFDGKIYVSIWLNFEYCCTQNPTNITFYLCNTTCVHSNKGKRAKILVIFVCILGMKYSCISICDAFSNSEWHWK